MKKAWFMFVLGMLLLALTACSAGTSNDKNESLQSGEASPDEPVIITYFQPGIEQPNMREGIEEIIQRFEEAHPNIKVELSTVGWNDAYQKLVTDFSAGSAPDVIFGGTRWVPAFASMGAIMPLDDYAEEHIKLYHDPLQDNVRYQGSIYAIPKSFSARSLIYRSDLIDEPPTTWDELIEVAKKVQEENPGMYGFAVAGASHVSTVDQYMNYVYQNGGEAFDEQGNAVLNAPEAVEALQFYADLYLKHQIVPNPVEYNREQLPILFQEGKIAMFVCGPWARPIMGIEPDNEETPYKTALLPKGKQISNVLVSDSVMISANTKHPDAAWTFIEFITSPEEQKKWDIERGLVPIQKEEAKDPFFREDPYFATFVDMVEYGKPAPEPLAWEPFQEIVVEAVQRALMGEDPQQVLDEAVQKIKDQQLEPKQ